MTALALSLQRVNLQRGSKKLFHDLDFQLEKGAAGLLTGPSGSGKSSLIAILNGTLIPDRGAAIVLNMDMSAISARQLAKLRGERLATIYQDFNLINDYSVGDNVALTALVAGRKVDKGRVEAILEELALPALSGRPAASLSGGEKQRVAVARALYNNAELVLADEPTGNLDDEAAALVINAFKRLAAAGATLLIATHDSRLTEHFPVKLHLEH